MAFSDDTSRRIRFTRFAVSELGRSSTLATAAGAPMALVCAARTGPQIRVGTDDPDASTASASSAPWSIEFFAAAGVRLPRDGVFLEFL